MSTTWLVWDTKEPPPEGEWVTVLWQDFGYGNSVSVCSLPQLIEKHADSLRERYLAWIYDIGESYIQGERLVDHLELRPGFSYWWMTLIAEKSNAYKSLQIIDAVKLMALEDLVNSHSVSKIIVRSDNKLLVRTLKLWCCNAGLLFELCSLPKRKMSESWYKRFYHSLPYPMQGLVSLLRYVSQRWPLKQNQEANRTGEMTFVDYLIHLDQEASITGRFASNFWTGLVGLLDSSGVRVHWLHHYIQHEAIPSPRHARDLIDGFNEKENECQCHSCLDNKLSISLLLFSLHDYIRLIWVSLKLTTIKNSFCPKGSRLNFWQLFKSDWLNSMRGPIAMWNCLCLNLLERTIRQLPHQKLGIYLQENQGWEMAFIHTWRAAGHGCLIGVPHSTVRYWDLRYFYDTRSYVLTKGNALPIPDKIALNGPVALAAYRKGGYPEGYMVEVEALRYMYLADQGNVRTVPLPGGPLRVLVLGDYTPTITGQQMRLLVEAAPSLPSNVRYIVKPHPNCPIKAGEYPTLRLHMTDTPLKELFADCDVAYTSNITASAVDAYCSGIPIVSALDGKTFNMSPLRGLKGIMYVTKPSELAEALSTSRDHIRSTVEPYFCLDNELPRWRSLLDIHAGYNVIADHYKTI
jgi:surface carbohydrate biosynthesis protein (TIGR04326 family)